jgi:hypothetical protein
MVRLLTRISSESAFPTDALSPEDAGCLLPSPPIKVMVSHESRGLLERAFDLCFQHKRKSSRGPREIRLWLDEEKRLFPGPNHSGEKHQEQAV